MLYENENDIAIFTKINVLWSVSFLQNHFFYKAYENFSFASAVGPLISGIYIRRTLKNKPRPSLILHSIIMHAENAQAHGGAFICFWLLCMNLKRQNSKMCLLYSQSMLYENDNYIAIFTTKKCFCEVFHFYKTNLFTKAYENF